MGRSLDRQPSIAMTNERPNTDTDKLNPDLDHKPDLIEKILCPHCQRTATNGIKCKGLCVADNDY